MRTTQGVYGVWCIDCQEGIGLITIPPGGTRPEFEHHVRLYLTCPRCKSRHAYSTDAIVRLDREDSEV